MKKVAASATLVDLVSAKRLIEVAMIMVSVRELKQRASELVRLIMLTGEDVQITDDGKAVALLVPAERARSKLGNAPWFTLDQFAAKIKAERNVDKND